MELYKVNSLEDITPELVYALVERYKVREVPRLEKLDKYYRGENKINERVEFTPDKPNNKVSNPFAAYIVDSTGGYFLGKPILYRGEDTDLMVRVQSILDRNLEEGHNIALGKDLSTFGVAYELLYLDDKTDVRFHQLSPLNTFMIYDKSLDGRPVAGVRFYNSVDYLTDDVSTQIELYTDDKVIVFKQGEKGLEVESSVDHYFGGVPIVYYYNNQELQGDFEKVIPLIDAYDTAVSDTVNNLDYFADAYLAISDSTLEPEDIGPMKENRVMLLNDGAKAEWLVKGADTVQAEELKERLREDIFTLVSVPDMTQTGGSTASGESMKYRLIGLDNKIAGKERLFAKSLDVRLKFIVSTLNLKGGSFENNIEFRFQRNLPDNYSTDIENAVKLSGIVSHRTQLELLSNIIGGDVDAEMERFQEDTEDNPY